MSRIRNYILDNKTLLFILFLAFVLRMWGITHEFPFITHPDEPSVIRSALGLRFELNPKHFDWPHMYFYINYFVFLFFIKARGLFQVLGLQPLLGEVFPLIWQDPLVFYFISRVVTVIFSTFTIIPIYATTKHLFNKEAALLASLVFCLIPFHVWHSHYALIDVPTTFWVAWAMYFSSKIYTSKKVSNYVLGGLMIGFAASTKYNGGLLCLVIPVAHTFRILESGSGNWLNSLLEGVGFKTREKFFDLKETLLLVYSGLSAFFGFILGTPFALFDYKNFSRNDGPIGAYWQFSNVGKVDFVMHLQNFLRVLFVQLPENFGYTTFYIFLLGVLYLLFITITKRKYTFYALYLVIIPALFLIYYVSGFAKTRSHYFMPSYPFVAVVVGVFLNTLLSLYKKSSKVVTFICLGLLLVIPLYYSVLNSYIFSRPSTRNLLYFWLQENVKEDTILVYDSSSLLPVLEKFSKNEIYKRAELPTSGKGYIILNLGEDEFEELSVDNNAYLDLITRAGLSQVAHFTPEYRQGATVLVYSF